MDKHSQEECPKCGNMFNCKVNNIFHCDCMNIRLSPQQASIIREYTEMNYGSYSCLCMNCLKELSENFKEK